MGVGEIMARAGKPSTTDAANCLPMPAVAGMPSGRSAFGLSLSANPLSDSTLPPR